MTRTRTPLSVTEIFRVGIGPSSSHTVGPMRAAAHFAAQLPALGFPPDRLTIELMGSLGATGRGHATDRAVLLGLAGHQPENVAIGTVESIMGEIDGQGAITVPGIGAVPFEYQRDVHFLPDLQLPHHANALTLTALNGDRILATTYYSIGGGFVEVQVNDDPMVPVVEPLTTPRHITADLPHSFTTAAELMAACGATELSIAEVTRRNELARRSPEELDTHLDMVANTMLDCIDAGLVADGVLPGVLRVPRRAKALAARLTERTDGRLAADPAARLWAATAVDPMRAMDWVNLYSLAVNEENAAGHRVVTSPTNGAAGVIPGVLGYLITCCPEAGAPFGVFSPVDARGLMPYRIDAADPNPRAVQRRLAVHDFLLAATAIGSLIKNNASIAGAEVGCQGEVGSAAAMAAAGLTQAVGGTPNQVENAAEIAMEHHLGLTCDPVAGLVQVPCIERNAVAAIKAINAARMAMWGDGRHKVSFDAVIETMRQTGIDMLSKYKETSAGGLAVNVVEC